MQMAELTSIGVHVPVALPYLIEEGLLPQDPPQELYQWETYVFDESHGDVEEEILATKSCVVWSQGKFFQNVYRLELEGEEVIQALLTTFPLAGSSQPDKGYELKTSTNRTGNARVQPTFSTIASGDRDGGSRTEARALVVFLRSKAHISFLHGSSHIVDLPFEVARAFPAPLGVIMQRKISLAPSLPPTPQIPAAPPNSFLSSQLQPSSSYLQSPMIAKSFTSAQPRSSPLSGKKRLDALFQDVQGDYGEGAEEEVAALYSLTNPLSDVGVVSYSIQHQKPRLSSKTQGGLRVEFEPLDSNEDVVYVSSTDEIAGSEKPDSGPLVLIVTENKDTQTVTTWHAWYIDERSLASLLKQRAAHKAAKARRRSSFLNAGMGTGTATPAVRHREGTRDSFAGAGSMRLPGEPTAPQPSAASSRKPTRQEEEDAMASQMDPDYQHAASQQTARDSRRISSLNADVRASQHNPAASFGGPGGRRNASFGGPNERRSFGHRKSRGSTPGSVFSRSLGPDDDLMDVDSSMDGDSDEAVDGILRHIRATFEAAGAESILGSTDDDFRRELIVRKLHSFSLPSQSDASKKTRVVTLTDLRPLCDSDDQRLGIYFHESHTGQVLRLQLLVKHRALWPELSHSQTVAIPVITGESALGQCADMLKLKDGGIDAILLADQGVIFSLDDRTYLPTPQPPPYRMYDPLDVASLFGRMDKDVGRNRTLEAPNRTTLRLVNRGAHGRYDELGIGGVHHRLQMKLRPKEEFVASLLEVCRYVLPARQAQMLSGIWCHAFSNLISRPGSLCGTAESAERVAFTVTMFTFVLHLLHEKARAALKLSRVAASKASGTTSLLLRKKEHERQRLGRTAWCWMNGQQPQSSELALVSAPGQSLEPRKDQLMIVAAALADELLESAPWSSTDENPALQVDDFAKLILGLHIYNEEQKLCTLSCSQSTMLAPLIAQLGGWLGLDAWGYDLGGYYDLEGASEQQWSFVKSSTQQSPQMPLMDGPVGVFHWFERSLNVRSGERYPTLDVIANLDSATVLSKVFQAKATAITPRIAILSDILTATNGLSASATSTVELMEEHGMSAEMMETLPEAIAAPFRDAISKCEREPPTTWTPDLLTLVGREDLVVENNNSPSSGSRVVTNFVSSLRDVQTICQALDHPLHSARTREAGRHAVSQLIFNEDRRLIEATSLMHYNSVQVAECPKQPDWSDAYHFEQQRRVMQWVTTRMIALPAGDAMIHYDSQALLLTDKYHLTGFSSSCLMQPMGHTLTTDRSGLTEEKVNWAYFHAGASAGLRISRNVTGIDTSWIAFNKPNELTNRHAGLLLALGLSGHLRHLAKWLSFKYLTPKHSMTSVGLLLGLSASYMGTTDSLITRMLSVHITRMLPPGAAELNVSPITQTAGLVGIGLLYCNTQQRRMSEIMLSEVEHMELEDPDSGPDPLRDESYRLAAGFALGYINLGKGKDLRGLHGMSLPERLLAIAVGPRPVSAVHVFDRATAGAVIAIALVYMKSGDKAVARKIDIPDTQAQFDHVRPDVLMLRAMANHLILWDNIEVKKTPSSTSSWMEANMPACYQTRFQEIKSASGRHPLKSSDVPFFNVATGLAWALSLKYAGSGSLLARNEILTVLDYFYMVKGGADAYYYDAKLARSTVRRCIDVLALAAATVMAGTGDLRTFRYLRRLHGRTDAETPYGSHLAGHLAIGTLFLGGGTFTFGTSNLAVASLICAFYPLFPTDVHDNHVHLQALRHLWVFAAEARCLVIEESDAHRPISMPIVVTLKDGPTKSLTAPCLLPELDTIATVQTNDPAYWGVTLDFASNPEHLSTFRQNQRIFVRRCPASEAHHSVFSATLAAMNDADQASSQQVWHSIFNLPVFKELDKADLDLILPREIHSAVQTDERGTVVDDRLVLAKAVGSSEKDALWSLRVLFAWAERARHEREFRLRWIGNEVVEALKAKVEERVRAM